MLQAAHAGSQLLQQQSVLQHAGLRAVLLSFQELHQQVIEAQSHLQELQKCCTAWRGNLPGLHCTTQHHAPQLSQQLQQQQQHLSQPELHQHSCSTQQVPLVSCSSSSRRGVPLPRQRASWWCQQHYSHPMLCSSSGHSVWGSTSSQSGAFSTSCAVKQRVAAVEPEPAAPHATNTTTTSATAAQRSSRRKGGAAVQQQQPAPPAPAPGTPPPHPPAASNHQQQQQQKPKQHSVNNRHFAARHLRQYLASISSSGFVDDLAAGIRGGDRLAISRSLTLCESTRPDHALQAAALLRKLVDNNSNNSNSNSSNGNTSNISQQPPSLQPPLSPAHQQQQQHHQQQQQQLAMGSSPSPSSGVAALRVGVSGPPGAGKSSLIETWGCHLADHGSKVAVLAVDPSSMESGGAILGDKTRMARLSSHSNAYVRPSPARGTLGGVSRATYDAMLICEAAGYDRILIETVGVGQSEVAVADLVDCMVLVMPPVGGDDLQMIKRGIMEVADVVVVNKADGDTEKAAARAATEYGGCLHLMPHRYRAWEPQALPVSAHTGRGVPALARLITQFQQDLTDSGELQRCRMARAESVAWLSLEEQLLEGLRQDTHVRWLLGRLLLPMVRAGTMAPRSAADIALAYFYEHCG